jgi:hypothetical protein
MLFYLFSAVQISIFSRTHPWVHAHTALLSPYIHSRHTQFTPRIPFYPYIVIVYQILEHCSNSHTLIPFYNASHAGLHSDSIDHRPPCFVASAIVRAFLADLPPGCCPAPTRRRSVLHVRAHPLLSPPAAASAFAASRLHPPCHTALAQHLTALLCVRTRALLLLRSAQHHIRRPRYHLIIDACYYRIDCTCISTHRHTVAAFSCCTLKLHSISALYSCIL